MSEKYLYTYTLIYLIINTTPTDLEINNIPLYLTIKTLPSYLQNNNTPTTDN